MYLFDKKSFTYLLLGLLYVLINGILNDAAPTLAIHTYLNDGIITHLGTT